MPSNAPLRLFTTLTAAMPLIAGCDLWKGTLEPRLSRSVSQHTRDMVMLDFDDYAEGQPVDVDQALAATARKEPAGQAPPAEIPLTVADLRKHALSNNLDLDVVLWDPEIARTEVSEEEAKFDATIKGSIRYVRKDLPSLDGDLVRFSSGTKEVDKALAKLTEVEQVKDSLEMKVGADVPLPTGGKVGLYQTFDEANKRWPQRHEQYVSAVKFSLSQPLLRGAGADVNVASIRLARLDAGVVSAKTRLAAIRVLAAVEKAYWRAYGARQAWDIRRNQLELATENLELVRRRVEEGLSPEIEIIRAELGVTGQLESLVMAETDHRISQRQLRVMLNMNDVPLESSSTFTFETDPQVAWYDLSAADLTEAAMANRMELLEQELRLAQDALRIDVARNNALPYFALDFEYGLLDRGASFSSSWDGQWDFDKNEFAVGLRGEIPVTNNAREARLRRAVLKRMQRLSGRNQRELAIKQEIHDAVDLLNQNWQRILAARKNVLVAGVNYEAELRQFQDGLRTMREVLEALDQLGDAQIREVKAILAYQVSQIDLAYAAGMLLGYARVGLEPLNLEDARLNQVSRSEVGYRGGLDGDRRGEAGDRREADRPSEDLWRAAERRHGDPRRWVTE